MIPRVVDVDMPDAVEVSYQVPPSDTDNQIEPVGTGEDELLTREVC